MNPVDVVAAVGKAVADGLTLAAEILCPRDHTAEERLRSWESAAVAVEGEICDEAEACEAAECTCPEFFCPIHYPDSSAAVSAAADPSPTVPNAHSVVGGEGSGGASDILQSAPPERPQCGAQFWCRDLYICSRPRGHDGLHGYAGVFWPEAEAEYPKPDPGAVSTPAPGEREPVGADELSHHLKSVHLSLQLHSDKGFVTTAEFIKAATESLLADYVIATK